MLEKSPENPLDNKKIKPVNPKGNQHWVFIGKTDAEADGGMKAFCRQASCGEIMEQRPH